MKGVYGSYAESLQEIRSRDAEIQKDFANRYGIDMKELFEEYYAAKKDEPGGGDEPKPDKKPEPDKISDDLLL
mgnify:CR=1 FL=1